MDSPPDGLLPKWTPPKILPAVLVFHWERFPFNEVNSLTNPSLSVLCVYCECCLTNLYLCGCRRYERLGETVRDRYERLSDFMCLCQAWKSVLSGCELSWMALYHQLYKAVRLSASSARSFQVRPCKPYMYLLNQHDARKVSVYVPDCIPYETYVS